MKKCFECKYAGCAYINDIMIDICRLDKNGINIPKGTCEDYEKFIELDIDGYVVK